MKALFLLLIVCVTVPAGAQGFKYGTSYDETYVSFAPLTILEPQAAPGIGLGHRWSKRTSSFLEASYLFPNPYYDLAYSLKGFRLIGQIRYHLYDSPNKKKKNVPAIFGKEHSFVALEGRFRRYNFSQSANFYNAATTTSLNNFPYTATANVIGTALLLGNSFTLNAKETLLFELSFGFGVKKKTVTFHNLPGGYHVEKVEKLDWNFVPAIEEENRTVYLPFALRLQYRFH